MALRTIPLIDAGTSGALAALEAAPDHLVAIIGEARRFYGSFVLRAADAASRRWLAKSANPYQDEIEAVAARIQLPGAYMLNLSYEWGCTTGVGPDPAGPGARMLRTLDWPLDGLGRNLVVSRHESPAGPYFNVTWPGFTGIATAMAPGRFSAALNQPPMRWTTPLMALDWLINRAQLWRLSALPPVHLMRRVFETCKTFAEARAMLAETPVCMPAFFSLAGAKAGEACAIERVETRAALRDGPASTANHWIELSIPGRARGTDSVGRWHRMEALRPGPVDGFNWVAPPILNAATRLAVVANAHAGTLAVQGWESDGPATEVFRL